MVKLIHRCICYMCVIYLYIHIFDLFGFFTNTHTCLNEVYTVVGFLNLLVMFLFFFL